MSPSATRQRRRPELASTAMVWLSRVLKNTRPSAYAAPRFTTSQQATPCAAGTGFGSTRHFTGAVGFVRSRAYSVFGYGVTMYIVVPTTSGAASWPRTTPVENVHATRSVATFEA